jgi:hypothetical protein
MSQQPHSLELKNALNILKIEICKNNKIIIFFKYFLFNIMKLEGTQWRYGTKKKRSSWESKTFDYI